MKSPAVNAEVQHGLFLHTSFNGHSNFFLRSSSVPLSSLYYCSLRTGSLLTPFVTSHSTINPMLFAFSFCVQCDFWLSDNEDSLTSVLSIALYLSLWLQSTHVLSLPNLPTFETVMKFWAWPQPSSITTRWGRTFPRTPAPSSGQVCSH